MQRTNDRTQTNQEKDNTMTLKKKIFNWTLFFLLLIFLLAKKSIDIFFLERNFLTCTDWSNKSAYACAVISTMAECWTRSFILTRIRKARVALFAKKKVSVKFPFDI